MKIDYLPGYRSGEKRMWGWLVTTKHSQFFIGIRTRVSP